MSNRLTWTNAETARALGRSRPWFLRNRKRLAALGFPPPLPFRLDYDPEAELRWQTELDHRAEALGRL